MKQKWKNHMMKHAGRKPHECEECGVGFVHKQSWAAHIRLEIIQNLQCICKSAWEIVRKTICSLALFSDVIS